MPKFNLANFFGMDTDQPENQIDKPADNVVLMNRQELETSSIVVFEPVNYTDVDTIAQKLLEDSAVIIKLDKLDNNSAARMVDFLNGVLFAIHGSINRLARNIFICSPKKFQVTE
ncbi:cell division protein SepF [Lentilactobacillus buchneri]|uniref:cell division protein SepF n=1 Tax=Lentilactobacillus buchneri TaxID=1581 RepID=UPI0021A6D6C5|nr:cell division protein SepF [Lentilactobacillus buchneri]MCT2882829.1 cell division protein SepF [Lentilactobacillus buchneri]